MTARPDNLDVLPFADVADADPNALPFGEEEAATHTGPVLVRFADKWVTVLCPLGHVVTGRELDWTFSGSWLAARIGSHQSGRDPWVVTCDGAS